MVDTIKNNKGPGYDRIDGRILKNLIKNFKYLFKLSLENSMYFGYFPSNSEEAHIFFQKMNKDPINS